MNTIFVQGFNGTFKGAGEGQTVIDSMAILNPNDTVTVMPAVEPWPFLFGFSGGNVSVSDMGFSISAQSPAVSWTLWGNTYTAIGTIFLVTGSANSTFDRVSFTAGGGDSDGYDVNTDIAITGTQVLSTQADTNGYPIVWPKTGGSDSVTRCSFAGDYGINVYGLTAGMLMVGGSVAQQNVFNEYYAACWFTDNSNSDIVVSNNQMTAEGGGSIFLWQGYGAPYTPLPPLPAPRYLISDNGITANGGANGMWIEDDSSNQVGTPPDRLDATIAGNSIHLDNGGGDGGIDGFFADGIKVLFNRIWGTGLAGIDVGTEWWYGPNTPATPTQPAFINPPSSGWQIIGNDVSGVTLAPHTNPSWWGYQLPEPIFGAPIWFGPDATNCLVVGGLAPTKVRDQGTHNILINVHVVH